MRRWALSRPVLGAASVAAFALLWGGASRASETIEGALAHAYHNNPTLNAQRAANRATDEKVPQALSGYRPQVFGNADVGDAWSRSTFTTGGCHREPPEPARLWPHHAADAVQRIPDREPHPFRRSQVLAARETLRNTEQNVLLDGVTAYMNVIRDAAIVELQKQNIEAVRELLRATRDRFNVGEVTRTDVAQAEARLAAAESAFSVAQANLNASRAVYQRVIGEVPAQLTPGRPVEHLVPTLIDAALISAFNQHPAIAAARFGVDVASLQVKVAEGTSAPDAGARRLAAETP